MPALEEIVSTRDLQKRTKECLDKAESGPVSIQRPGGNAITMISRATWADVAQSHKWLSSSMSIMTYILLKGASEPATPPSDFLWLRAFDVEELREFATEITLALQNASAGLGSFGDVESVVKEWHHSAIVMTDDSLVERLDDVLENIKIK